MIKRKKILVCTTSYLPFIGGAEIAIREVSRRMNGVFDVYIITARFRRNLPVHEVVSEGTIIRVGFGTKFDKWLLPFFSFFTVMGLVIKGKIENPLKYHKENQTLLWGMDISQGTLTALLIKIFFPRIPFILTVQYGYGDKRLAQGRLGFIGFVFRRMLKGADHVTAISSYLLDTARNYGYAGDADVIPNGVDTDVFAFNPHDRGRERDSRQRVIITTSRLVQKNAVDILIRAVAEVKTKIPSVRCYIIGEGSERAALEKLTKDLQLIHEVIFLGSIPHEEIPFYLTKADVFVRASRSEGMGNSFIEAMSVGVPVIGTAVGGIPDIIDDNKTGIFCRTDDPHHLAEKIQFLMSDTRVVADLRENGRRLVEEKFSWDAITHSYYEIFESLLRAHARVLIATPLYPPEIGGPATYSKLLMDNLLRLGIVVRLMRFSEVRRLPKVFRHVAYAWMVAGQSRYADIVLALDPVSVGFPSSLAAMIMRKKFIVKIVGDYAWEQGVQRFKVHDLLDDFLKKSYGRKIEFLRKIERFTARRAKKIVVPSHYLKRVVSQWGIAEKKITVIPNSFDLPRSFLSYEDARKVLEWQGPLIVSAGRFVPWKGFEVLIESMTECIKEIPNLSLVIVGSGPQESDLQKKVRMLGLESHVRFAGNISHEDMLTYLVAADAFVLNTGYEGFSHILLEAMAVGTRVITTSVGGNPELVTHEENGFLTEYNNKDELSQTIINALRMPVELRERMVESAQTRARQFSASRMLADTADFLVSL